MEILATGWAPSRAAAVAFFEACQIAEADADGNLVPVADCVIHPFRPHEELIVQKATGQMIEDEQGNMVPEMATVAGWHFNIRFHSGSAETLTAGLPQVDQDGAPLGLFERTHILDLVSARTGEVPVWDEVNLHGTVAGYEINAPGQPYHQVRCFDPTLINSPSNVFQ